MPEIRLLGFSASLPILQIVALLRNQNSLPQRARAVVMAAAATDAVDNFWQVGHLTLPRSEC